MKIGICSDHGGLELKKLVTNHLISNGYDVINYGTDSSESCDYPIFANKMCKGIQKEEVEFGIAICTTGVGMSIACNKHKGIRACCCSDTVSAQMTREHNNANVICFGAKIISTDKAYEIVDVFLSTQFSNGERHLRRINEISSIENNEL